MKIPEWFGDEREKELLASRIGQNRYLWKTANRDTAAHRMVGLTISACGRSGLIYDPYESQECCAICLRSVLRTEQRIAKGRVSRR